MLRLGEGNAAEGAADITARALQVGRAPHQAGVGDRLQAGHDRKLREAIEPACAPGCQIALRVEIRVVNLGRQSRAKRGWIESGDQADR